MPDRLIRIEAPKFVACVVLAQTKVGDWRVKASAPILAYMRRGEWSEQRVRSYCTLKHWKCELVP